ncbi:MAG: putative Zn-dependent protease [Saprospiraceae bacterium]|jgi:predicted Zn-dependent protease
MSEKREKGLGQSYNPQVVGEMGLYQDVKLQKFIESKGQQMAKVSHRPNLGYKFQIVDSPVVNAFAVPGGYVYFTRGIMAHFNNEAEFAGVLGHEIGHITARHSAKQMRNATLAQVGVIASAIAFPRQFQQFGDLAQNGLGLFLLKNGRYAESQSDVLGVHYSTKIGYDAKEMAEFFNTIRRLSEDSGQSIPTFLSTHPDPADRNKNVKALATEIQGRTSRKFNINRNS